MKKALEKLQNKSGLSILLALLFVFCATMVIAVILAAANTNSRNFAAERERDQAYLTVSSAAMYIRDEICMYGFQSVKEQVDAGEVVRKTSLYDINATPTNGCDFKPLMDFLMDKFEEDIDKGKAYDGTTISFHVNVDMKDDSGDAVFEPVFVTLTIDKNREINVTCTLFQEKVSKYQMTINFPADHWDREATKTSYDASNTAHYTTTYTTEWSWTKGSITKG